MNNQQWIYDWFNKVWAQADLSVLTQLAAEPLNFHLPGGKIYPLSHTDYLNFVSIWCQRFRDVAFRIVDVVQESHKTVVIYECEATYSGGWARIPAKKQKVHMTGMLYFVQQEDGKICDCRLEDSSFDLYQQLTRYLD